MQAVCLKCRVRYVANGVSVKIEDAHCGRCSYPLDKSSRQRNLRVEQLADVTHCGVTHARTYNEQRSVKGIVCHARTQAVAI